MALPSNRNKGGQGEETAAEQGQELSRCFYSLMLKNEHWAAAVLQQKTQQLACTWILA